MTDELQREEERGVSILLRYQGSAVDDGTMNVYDDANMVAFSNFVVAAAHKLYGEDVQVTADITAFKHASFGTDGLTYLQFHHWRQATRALHGEGPHVWFLH